MLYNSVSELVGNTPLIRIKGFEKKYNIQNRLYVKLDKYNPGGSAKDRIAFNMLDMAEKDGLINKGSVIIEPTSGNTGIGLCLACKIKGYRAIIIMPDNMSEERKSLMRAYGAELILTDGKLGMKGSCDLAVKLSQEIKNSFIPSQFENKYNPQAHYLTTGPEIYRDLNGNVDVFVAGVGTGGTVSGVGKFLKEKNTDTEIIAVEPETSPLLSKGTAGAHGIQGIGANFVPKTLDRSIIDRIVTVSDKEAYNTCKDIFNTDGLLLGISSGANICASLKISSLFNDKNIVIMTVDSGERYLSSHVFD